MIESFQDLSNSTPNTSTEELEKSKDLLQRESSEFGFSPQEQMARNQPRLMYSTNGIHGSVNQDPQGIQKVYRGSQEHQGAGKRHEAGGETFSYPEAVILRERGGENFVRCRGEVNI
ncbi:hypothetical protein DFH09DRAFT_1100159 [Mycena vulgaris]|nr:hypothetical protein DFH09DRAFT_1100159 [Mycena vulgaris]